MTDFPEFVVAVEPVKVAAQDDDGNEVLHTVYDIRVKDANGKLLVFSKQGYENRKEAEWIATRLFGSTSVIASFLGVDPDLVSPETAVLRVYDANGGLDHQLDLR